MTDNTEHEVAFNISSFNKHFWGILITFWGTVEDTKITKVKSLLSKNSSYIIQKLEIHKYENASIMNKECKMEKTNTCRW